MAEVAAVVVKLRDLAARSESHRKAEKEVWLVAVKRSIVSFFDA
jgi:hypothetical protein